MTSAHWGPADWPVAGGVPAGRVGRIGAGLLLLGAVATPWNGVQFDGLQPGDWLLAVSLTLLLFSAARERRPLALPWWLTVLAVVAAAVAITQVFLPVDGGYVAQRFVLVAYGGGGPDQPSDNLVDLLHWEVALLALPLAAVLAARILDGYPHKLATAWLIGCSLSALVALTDEFRVTAISAWLLPFTDISGRQAGLTSQPNNVAVAAAMALPCAVYWAAGRTGEPPAEPLPRTGWGHAQDQFDAAAAGPGWWGRLFGWCSGAVLLGGTFVAGSRGGTAAAILSLLISLAATPAGRRLMPKLVIATMIASPFLASALADTWTSLQQALRLGGGDSSSAAASDQGRAMLAHQALRDFAHAPFRGIGLWVITESHSIYLQLLAAGGIVLLLAFVVFLANAMRTGVLFTRLTGDPFGLLMTISIATWAVVGVVENQLTDRYLYLPAACVACLTLPLAASAALPTCEDAQQAAPPKLIVLP